MERDLQLRRNIRLYINQVKKASPLLGHCTPWRDPDPRAIASGLADAQDRSFAFPNCVCSQAPHSHR